mgnify:CR=1 FL=1
MLRILTREKYRDLILFFALLCFGGVLVLYPTQSMEAGRRGLELCVNVIVPSLFPFFVLSSMVIELGMARYLGRLLEGLMWPLFRVGGAGASALVLGFVGGYPVGAHTAIDLYEKGLCSRTETQRLLAFCNNSGPAFILGVVGAGVFGSGKIALVLYLAHVTACLCVGLLFRFYRSNDTPTSGTHRCPPQFHTTRFSQAFTASVKNALSSVLNICAFVLFFTVVIRLLFLCGAMDLTAQFLSTMLSPLKLSYGQAQQLLTGFLELSSGVTALSGGGALSGRISMAAFILGWAGLSVHCQVLSFLGSSGLSAGTYLVGKALHGVLSAIFTTLLSRVFPLPQPVSSYLTQQAETLAALDVGSVLTLSIVAAWLLWFGFLSLSLYAIRRSKKRGGKHRRYAL